MVSSTATSVLALYLEASVVLALAGASFATAVRWGGRRILVSPARWAGFGWGVMVLAIGAPLGWRASGVGGGRPATVEIWGSHGPTLSGLGASGAVAPDLGVAAGVWTG